MSTENTEELIRDFQSSTEEQKRESIFSKIYGGYIDLVYYALNQYKSIFTKVQIQDLAQDAMVDIAQQLDDLEWISEQAFKGWIYKIAFRKAYKQAEKLKCVKIPNNIEDNLS